MDHSASPSPPSRLVRRILPAGLALLGLAGVAFVVRRPLLMSAPRCLAGRWHGCYDTFNGVVLMMLVGLPLAALARCRRAAGVAPVRFAAFASMPRILALGAGCSVLVETAQYVLWLDRVSSVDDVLVNATGAVLAGLASRHWWRTPAEVPSQRPCPAPVAAG